MKQSHGNTDSGPLRDQTYLVASDINLLFVSLNSNPKSDLARVIRFFFRFFIDSLMLQRFMIMTCPL